MPVSRDRANRGRRGRMAALRPSACQSASAQSNAARAAPLAKASAYLGLLANAKSSLPASAGSDRAEITRPVSPTASASIAAAISPTVYCIISPRLSGTRLPLNGAQGYPCLGKRSPNAPITTVDIAPKMGVTLGSAESSAINDVHRDRRC
jgi:hypothetical protein